MSALAERAESRLTHVVEDWASDAESGERYAALYVRVSTGKQKDNWSVKDQLGLARLGQERGLRVQVYDEQGVSGETIEDRPTMKRLLADIRAGKVAAVIAVSTSRLSRDEDIIDTLHMQKACRDNATIVITPEKVYDYSGRTDTILGQIQAIFDADQKQANVKAMVRGQYQKARAGGYVGMTVPYGYRLVPGEVQANGRRPGHLEIDAEQAAIVRQMFDLYVNGWRDEAGEWRPMTCRGIARFLNEQGTRIPVKIARRRRDGSRTHEVGDLRPFSDDDVKRLLRKRYYIGLFSWGETRLSKWVRDDGAAEVHLPELQLVDVGTWQRAQAQRKERDQQPRRSLAAVHPLASLLRCPRCGEVLLSGARTLRLASGELERYPSYTCANHRRYGRAKCKGYMISERLARAAVEVELIEQLQRLRLRDYLEQAADEAAAATEGEIAQSVLAELQATDDNLARLVRSVAEGVFTPAEARNLKLEYLEKKERLEGRLKKLRERAQVREDLQEAVRRAESNVPQRIRSLGGAEFRQLARLVFKRLMVMAEGAGPTRTARVVDRDLTDAFKRPETLMGLRLYPKPHKWSLAHLEGPLGQVLAMLQTAI